MICTMCLMLFIFDSDIQNDSNASQASNNDCSQNLNGKLSQLKSKDFDYDCSHLIRIRGLPWTTTKKEICEFFKGVNILNGENGIHLVTFAANSSRPLGEAYIQLASKDDFELAQTFNRQNLGSRYIEGTNTII